MEFRAIDIIKTIIPGTLILVGTGIFFCTTHDLSNDVFSKFELKDSSEIILLSILVCSYFLGYLNDSISSWLESIIYNLTGRPSLRLLVGLGGRLRLVNHAEIVGQLNKKSTANKFIISNEFDTLSKKSTLPNSIVLNYYLIFTKKFREEKNTSWAVFKYANIMKDENRNETVSKRVSEYYYSYIFSRNILFSYVIFMTFLIISLKGILHCGDYFCLLLILLLLIFRKRDKSYYYSRQVLIAACSDTTESSTKDTKEN